MKSISLPLLFTTTITIIYLLTLAITLAFVVDTFATLLDWSKKGSHLEDNNAETKQHDYRKEKTKKGRRKETQRKLEKEKKDLGIAVLVYWVYF